MSLLGNIIWFILGGFISAIMWTIAGALCCITVIGIPFGMQCFKIAALTLFPFGKDVEIGNFGAGGLLGNILWIIFLGWELCIAHLVSAALCAITVIGIPFAVQHLKLARLALIPFGAEIK